MNGNTGIDVWGWIIIIIIVVGGIGLTVALIGNWVKLETRKGLVYDALNNKNYKSFFNKKTKEIEEKELDDKATPETMIKLETEFDKISSRYEIYAQLITIFPLMGILGTVESLVAQLYSAGGVEAVSSALGSAMITTLLGLIFAITTKAIASTMNNRVINETEILFDDYNKKLNSTIMLNSISDGE